VIPWVLLDSATMPGQSGALRLMRRGNEFAIWAGATALMNSRMNSSEIALAEIACDRLRGRKNCHMLIGGYGMGFTLRAAMAGLGGDARITVAELAPKVLEWARGPMAELTGACLSDPRVSTLETDVGGVIARARAGFDAILLDVDNGPAALSSSANGKLYSVKGLEAARRALRPGGLLAVWSAAPDAAFTDRLRRAGFAVDEVKVRANKGRGVRHLIWVATNKVKG
jgi:spermidine synthase